MSVSIAVSGSTDPRTRGLDLGRQWRAEIAATWESYDRLFSVHGIDLDLARDIALRTMDAVVEWSPSHADEVLSIAEGAGLEPWHLAALNGRSEILTRSKLEFPGECSTVVHLAEEGPPQTIQTWDWQSEMCEVKLVWRYDSRPGWTVKTFTEFGVLGKLGVNSAGLGLHFNLLQHTADGEGVGIPVHLIARRVLDEAESLEDVRDIAKSSPVTASAALTVVAREGQRYAARSFELSPAGVAELEPNDSGFLLHTNHFVDEELAKGERLGVTDGDTYARLDELDRRSPLLADEEFASRVRALVHHREDGAAICCHPEPSDIPGDSWATQLVIGLELDRTALVFQDGGPCAGSGSAYVRF